MLTASVLQPGLATTVAQSARGSGRWWTAWVPPRLPQPAARPSDDRTGGAPPHLDVTDLEVCCLGLYEVWVWSPPHP
jgi:hypothetical protein